MILAHKTRLNPTPEQEEYFRKAVGTVRFAFNWGLARWQELHEAGERPSALALKKEFNGIKDEQFPWVREVAGRCTEYGFTRLGIAFNNFFRRVKNGEAPGYPKFKSRKNLYQSFYVANTELKLDGHWCRIPRVNGWVNMAEPLRFEGKIMAATISTDGHRWYISITVEMNIEQEPQPGTAVGLDLGIKDLVVGHDSNGRTFTQPNGHHQKQMLKKLRRLNRQLARRENGSNGWLRTKAKLNKLHAQIRNRRLDAAHKFTTEIARNYKVICVENLNVKGMVKNRHLSRAISDVGWGELVRQLEYKALVNGGAVVKVGRFFASSQTCSACGTKNTAVKDLNIRQWTCPDCGATHDRDSNAAANILNEGLRLLDERRGTSRVET
jgi:putative transposase